MGRIFVTGAGGYIGTTLSPMLLDAGHEVRALDRFFFGRDLLATHPHLEILQDDTRHITPQHFENVDCVIDLAALSNDPTGEMFERATWEINCEARIRTARMAKEAGVKRYLLPSSCSVYGWQSADTVVDEKSPINPLTTYARANVGAERGVLALADKRLCVTVLRLATACGYSPRMRFDLAVNGMTYAAWKSGKLPVMRDGTQWRPMVHVRDAADAMLYVIRADVDRVNGEIFNVGSEKNNYQIGALTEALISSIPRSLEIDWYGDPDHRSYRVAFEKIERLGWRAQYTATDGARELYELLEAGGTEHTPRTITTTWYRELTDWHQVIKDVVMYGGIVEI